MTEDNRTGVTTADIAERNEERERAAPASRAMASEAVGHAPSGPEEPLTPLFPPDRVNELRRHWRDLQVGFVDDPRTTVKRADELVAQVMQDLAHSFADERANLEHQWDKGDQVSTEDLRLALRRYRSFFERFLAV